jgi:hypothetical protein
MNGPNIARDVRRAHLRLVEPLGESECGNEDADEFASLSINCDVDPDDPPLTILAW